MRSLLFRSEEKAAVSSSIKTATPITEEILPKDVLADEEMILVKESGKVKRVRPVLTAKQRARRANCIALSTFSIAAALLGRWIVANQNPVYPGGEAVYHATTTPKWGEMSQPNAETFYQAATDAYHVKIPESVKDGAYGLPNTPLSVQKAAIAQAQPALALLRQGMQYPYVPDGQTNYYSYKDSAIGLWRRRRNWEAMRETARMLGAEAHYKGATGDTAGALSSSLDAIRYGIDTGQGYAMVDGMVGKLFQSIGGKEALNHIDGLSATEARAGITRLEKMLPEERSFAQIMTAERNWGYEILQDFFKREEIRVFWEDLGDSSMEELQGRLAYKAVILWYSKQGLVSEYASHMDKIIAPGKMPYQQAARLEKIAPSSNPLVRTVMCKPETTMRAMTQCYRVEAQNKVLLTRLAVQAYKKEHNGQLPHSLRVLTEGTKPYLTNLPTDPFSETGKGLLRYNPKDGKVYSVGVNGIDEAYSGDDDLMS